MNNYMGIDPSLTATGIAVVNSDSMVKFNHTITTKLRGSARLGSIAYSVCKIAAIYKPKIIMIESLAYGASFQVGPMAELWGCIRMDLRREETPMMFCSPSTLKKFATGSGKAKKFEMRNTARVTFGFRNDDDNIIDAYFLARLAGNVDKAFHSNANQLSCITTVLKTTKKIEPEELK